MCQLIVFWYTCDHLILSSMKCPFDGATTHEEETTTVSLADYPCWLCKQGPSHAQWEKVERLKWAILTVAQLEFILDISSYDADFLFRIADFFARGDHKRWGQPGETKAKYTGKDPYIMSLELEVTLAARGDTNFPMNAGLMFDLEFLLYKRFDVTNVSTLFWPLKDWRAPSTSFYSSSTMKRLPSGNMVCDETVNAIPQLASQYVGGQASSSNSSDTPPSMSINTWSTTFPDPTQGPTAPGFPTSRDVGSDWMKLQDSDTSAIRPKSLIQMPRCTPRRSHSATQPPFYLRGQCPAVPAPA
ncbi:hypothetical protein P170DRAFT_289005 [Aspergillus steynii IBT 23096]|uniref:Uncharacterized protein n=1 Tax=Aspergillus steynii IBT 23096 TaxID=1392250 RepID=A0A2I2FVC8_9EURO|nr:uncharacterized protein P170DRAFT_289005 [Aspergillus steynii IBT 23096]PLB44599.1 hypothetical protein P170DRAFT_289005 [Aspergillus steynii IBT 23096]